MRGEGSQGASPITCVQKKDGTMRVCVDYTRLNASTRPLCYPLPRIDELYLIIPRGRRYFTNLYLKEAYYSLSFSADSRRCAAIIVHSDVFVPNRCVFGLKNEPMKFQLMMECLLTTVCCFLATLSVLTALTSNLLRWRPSGNTLCRSLVRIGKRFIGMVNCYHAFVPKLAEVTPLLRGISGGPKKTNQTIWKLDDIQVKAFENTKVANQMKPLRE